MNSIQLQTCDLPQTAVPLLELWQAALGSSWPITQDGFLSTILESGYQPGDCVVARHANSIVGAIITNEQQGNQARRGNIMCLFVTPELQRRGIGTALLHEAIQRLQTRGARTIYLGGGPDAYFWGGVPTNLPGAAAFFRAHGWQLLADEDKLNVDLTLPLQDYMTPAWVWERVRDTGISIGIAQPEEREEAGAFERQHFPGWGNAIELAFTRQRSIVVARTRQGEIAGTCITYLPGSGYSPTWSELLGAETGCLGEVGVAKRFRGLGIGMALSARATELMKEHGNKLGFVRWLSLISWYGKLGYTFWQSYYSEERPIEACLAQIKTNN